ncbi:DHHC palmitoyltransferase-domain-containing protein [Armillaria fumosa]|nr:DHHC palmitoyltransferase-domain-containing protein [Armillaria fumosa]
MPVSPHSLSFSPPGTPSTTKRTSLSQLPLPSTMTAAPAARRTHLPGINPSASFFRPSRPSFSRPSSSSSQPDEHPYDSDSFPLKRLHPLDEDDDHPPFRPTSKSSSVSSPSPAPSAFNPTPPPLPLNSIVVTDPLTHRPIRRYAQHPSRNRFFFHGRLLTSGDTPWAFAAALCLVFGITGAFFSSTAVWWWHNEGPGGIVLVVITAYLSLVTIVSMLVTAFSDPGILPRGLDEDPPYQPVESGDGTRAPMPRILKVRADVVRVKYCPTCRTYRPPRSTHCKLCDNCIDGCDHHCQWVNNCVGRRNYTSFFTLLLGAATTLIIVIISSALHLFFLTQRNDIDFRKAVSHGQGTGSAVAFCLSIAVIWPVGALLTYHMRLLLLNITTIEQIRNQALKTLVPGPAPPNPFSHGSWRRNIVAVLCRPRGYSWLDPTGVVLEDRREVNPGMTIGINVV